MKIKVDVSRLPASPIPPTPKFEKPETPEPPREKRRQTQWTESRIAVLIDMVKRGAPQRVIGEELGVTKDAVHKKVSRLRMEGLL